MYVTTIHAGLGPTSSSSFNAYKYTTNKYSKQRDVSRRECVQGKYLKVVQGIWLNCVRSLERPKHFSDIDLVEKLIP